MSEKRMTPDNPGTFPVAYCWHCGEKFEVGFGYGISQLFCSEMCADFFKAGVGA